MPKTGTDPNVHHLVNELTKSGISTPAKKKKKKRGGCPENTDSKQISASLGLEVTAGITSSGL